MNQAGVCEEAAPAACPVCLGLVWTRTLAECGLRSILGVHLLMPSTLLQVPSSLQEASLPPPAPRPAGPSLRAWTRLQTSVTSVLASKVTCGAQSAGPWQEGTVRVTLRPSRGLASQANTGRHEACAGRVGSRHLEPRRGG